MENEITWSHTSETIDAAFASDKLGGHLKPICNRRMQGYKCRCFVRYVEIDGIQYWKIFYLINQRPVTDDDLLPLVRKMYHVVRTAISILESRGLSIVVYRNMARN